MTTMLLSFSKRACPKLFILVMNASGPILLPCGMPPLTSSKFDVACPNLVLCFLPFKYEAIHGMSASLTPILSMLSSNLLWFIKWNALLKSKYSTLITVFGFSRAWYRLCNKFNRAKIVDEPGRHPYCAGDMHVRRNVLHHQLNCKGLLNFGKNTCESNWP